MKKSYKELSKIESFMDRYEYLRLSSVVGKETFGFDRYLNQEFYNSKEWKKVKREVLIRDNACDLGHPDHPIPNGLMIYTHHIIPVTIEDVINRSDLLLDPENLITTIFSTHQAIHYGDSTQVLDHFVERKPNDMCPWLC